MKKKIEMMESIKMMQIDLLNEDKKYDIQENDDVKNGEDSIVIMNNAKNHIIC